MSKMLATLMVVLICCVQACTTSRINEGNGTPEKIKTLLRGVWLAATDSAFILVISSDSIHYTYEDSLLYKRAIDYHIADSAFKYQLDENTFDFTTKDSFVEAVNMFEIDRQTNDTIVTTILYVDAKGMDIYSNGRTIGMRRLLEANRNIK